MTLVEDHLIVPFRSIQLLRFQPLNVFFYAFITDSHREGSFSFLPSPICDMHPWDPLWFLKAPIWRNLPVVHIHSITHLKKIQNPNTFSKIIIERTLNTRHILEWNESGMWVGSKLCTYRGPIIRIVPKLGLDNQKMYPCCWDFLTTLYPSIWQSDSPRNINSCSFECGGRWGI